MTSSSRAAYTILLSDADPDGTVGLVAPNKTGVRIVAQDPATAFLPFMPEVSWQRSGPIL